MSWSLGVCEVANGIHRSGGPDLVVQLGRAASCAVSAKSATHEVIHYMCVLVSSAFQGPDANQTVVWAKGGFAWDVGK